MISICKSWQAYFPFTKWIHRDLKISAREKTKSGKPAYSQAHHCGFFMSASGFSCIRSREVTVVMLDNPSFHLNLLSVSTFDVSLFTYNNSDDPKMCQGHELLTWL